ncbi:MAG: T9SS type A sorting domain-containing protein [Candidatus Cloacimonetes bacterium]|nr:T9SS type A sorting domain-containing protein [Candidatus Cloacimonadota bacterium]
MKRISLMIVLLLPVILLSYSWQVKHDGSGDFSTIQAAIENIALAAGDSIIVWSCADSIEHYYESLNIERDISFTLCSQQDSSGTFLTENTYICGDSVSTDLIYFDRYEIDSAQISVIGFTISHLDEVNGRGIYIPGGDSLTTSEIELRECKIVDNNCQQNGGGVYIYTSSDIDQPLGKITISECDIARNTARHGGGIAFENSSDELLIEYCSIENNVLSDTTYYGGGGIYLKSGIASLPSKVTIDETIVKSNFGGKYGGGFFAQTYKGNIYFTDSIFRDNEALSGGGIKIINSGTISNTGIQITNCEIINNSAYIEESYSVQNGGGINVVESNLTIEGTRIDSNYSHTDGGGIHIFSKDEFNGCKVQIIDSEITNNVAEGFLSIDPAGGGIFSSRSEQIYCDNVLIESNIHINGKGGGFAFIGRGAGSIQRNDIIDCNLNGNQAAGSGGGACIAGISKLRIENTEINSNTCNVSGCGLYFYSINDSIGISGCELKDNIQNNTILYTGQAGGGIYMYGCGYYNIISSVFSGNSNYEGSAIYADTGSLQIGDLENLLIADNYQCEHPDSTEFLGTIALDRGQNIEINNCTICNNESDTCVVDCGGISLGSANQDVSISETILWNNSGDEYDDRISENGIRYCDIEDLPFTGNYCFDADPVFTDGEVYGLHWLSPCIDAGNDNNTDPDGTYPDIGYKYHPQEVYNWEYNGSRISWEWRCFPKMIVADTINTGQYLPPDSVLTNWNPRPDSIHVEYSDNSDWLSGSWNVYEWQWSPDEDQTISSTMGMKMFRDNRGTKLYYRGGLCEADTELSISDSTKNWMGYFLKDSQQVSDAIPEAVMDSLLMVQTYRWSMSRNSTDQRWIGLPTYTFNYGDLVILKSVSDTTFCWEASCRSGEPLYREFAEHYEYEEKSDYIPIYAALNPGNLPDEIAIFVDGECRGAEKVDADTTQICAYILEEEIGQNIEFELWYGGRKEIEHYKDYLVHDQETGSKKSANLYTGMPGDYYLVSFEETDNVPQADIQLNCYPNPFNPELNIAFSLAAETPLEVNIYNIKGQKVRILANELYRAGDYEIVWDGKNNSGLQTSSGVYFIRLKAGKENIYRKAVMLK